MAYERYGRGDDRQRGYQGRDDTSYGGDNREFGRDPGANEDRYAYPNARGYRDAGWSGPGTSEYGQRDIGRTDEQRGFGAPRAGSWGNMDDGQGQNYAAGRGDGRSGQDYGSRDYARDPVRQARGTYNRQPQSFGGDTYGRNEGHDRNPQQGDDRGFIARAGDEVRSWFGDEDAEHRREADARRDGQHSGRNDSGRDEHYHSWRNQQIASFDRDYDEYRQENQSKFHNEFASFRTERQGQRDLLSRVEEHADVVGSDGEHVGTVDKVRGDRIILTKKDPDAGGHHHSIPSRWLQSAEGNKVVLRKTAAEARDNWRDEERTGAIGGQDQVSSGAQRQAAGQSNEGGPVNLNRSFSGTY